MESSPELHPSVRGCTVIGVYTAYINAVLSLANACDVFACWVGPAQCCYIFFLTVGAVSEQFGKGKKNPYQPGHVHEVNCKSTKGNVVITFPDILRNSVAPWGNCGRAGLRAGKF